MKAGAALAYFIQLCKKHEIKRILDIGAGDGAHANKMKAQGLHVETNDILPSDHQCFYHDLIDLRGFDGIWASHVLEHQLNPNQFLTKVRNDLHEGGVLSITVPPRKDLIVGGHVTLWNAGLLLYNLILAGFNCKDAGIASYGYNISVVLVKESIELPKLNYDAGDINVLKKYFPNGMNIKEGFNGCIRSHNWEGGNDLPAPYFWNTQLTKK